MNFDFKPEEVFMSDAELTKIENQPNNSLVTKLLANLRMAREDCYALRVRLSEFEEVEK